MVAGGRERQRKLRARQPICRRAHADSRVNLGAEQPLDPKDTTVFSFKLKSQTVLVI